MTDKIVNDQAVIVVIGEFQPVIFHPTWFSEVELISAEESSGSVVEVLHPDVAIFRAGWLRVEVTRERLRISTEDSSYFIALRDLGIGIMTVLEHTPVRMCGINRLLHFDVKTPERWHRIGHELAPKEHWRELVEEPGMQHLVIRGRRHGSSARRLEITVSPSTLVSHGVSFGFNEHFEHNPGERSVSLVRSALGDHWDAALAHFLVVANTLLTRIGDPHE